MTFSILRLRFILTLLTTVFGLSLVRAESFLTAMYFANINNPPKSQFIPPPSNHSVAGIIQATNILIGYSISHGLVMNDLNGFYPWDKGARVSYTISVYPITGPDVYELGCNCTFSNGETRSLYQVIFNQQESFADPTISSLIGHPTVPSQNPATPPTQTSGPPGHQSGGVQVADPINVATGNIYLATVDYSTAGQNQLRFERYYNSLASPLPAKLSLGSHWSSNFDRYVWPVANGTGQNPVAAIQRPTGEVFYFTLVNGVWKTNTTCEYQLTGSGSTFTVTDLEGNSETYSVADDGIGRLSGIKSHTGYVQTVSYDANKNLQSVKDSYGRQLNFTTDNDLLTSVSTPDQTSISFTYSSSGILAQNLDRLATITWKGQSTATQTLQYQASNLPFCLTGIIDENGQQYESWTYDQYGRGKSFYLGVGSALTQVAYNDGNGSRTVTYPSGNVETYLFSSVAGVQKVKEIDRLPSTNYKAASRKFTYDANGYLASETDWNGNLNAYTNDNLGRCIKRAEAVGTALGRVVSTSYFGNTTFPARVVEPGLNSTYTYDGNGNLLQLTQIDTTSATVPYITVGQQRVWSFGWANGLLTSVQSPRTDVQSFTRYAYDASGAITSVTTPLGVALTVNSHTPGGFPLLEIDINGVSKTFDYDDRQRIIRQSAAGTTQTSTYDPAGNLIGQVLADGSSFSYTYNSAHQAIKLTDALGNSQGFKLDASGNRQATYYYDPSGTLRRQSTTNFDILGRPYLQAEGNQFPTQISYDANGNRIGVKEPGSAVSTQDFDGLNRLSTTTNPLGAIDLFVHDAAGRLTQVTDARGLATRYIYDGFGDLIEKISPDSGKTIYYYDLGGNQIRSIDASGNICLTQYDALNRVITRTYSQNPSDNLSIRYDESGHGYGIGKITTISNAKTTIKRSYDAFGNISSEGVTTPVGTSVVKTIYDALGRKLVVTYPSGLSVYYRRDKMGQLIRLDAAWAGTPGAKVVYTINVYLPFGPAREITMGNGIRESRTYDLTYRLASMASNFQGKSRLQQYSFDNFGNISGILDSGSQEGGQSFGYDLAHQLTSFSQGSSNHQYSYDVNGNRIGIFGSSALSYKIASGSNELLSTAGGGTTRSFSYTPTGQTSLISDGDTSFGMTFNSAGRIAAVFKNGSPLLTSTYDGFGRRVQKTSFSGSTMFIYDDANNVLEEIPIGSGVSSQQDYIYTDDGRLVGINLASSKVIEFVQSDHLNRPKTVTDSTGAQIWSADYDPFGSANITGTFSLNLREPGQYFDPESGFAGTGFRDYAPTLGRFLQSDPIGLAGGLNPYAFADNNPLSKTDFWGLSAKNINVAETAKSFGADDTHAALLDWAYTSFYLL